MSKTLRGNLFSLLAVTAIAAGLGTFLGRTHAQVPPAAPPPVPSAPAPAASAAAPVTTARLTAAAVPGTLTVTRLTDTSFVVVKDQGDAQLVTLFSTEGGLVQKKHSGRFFY